MPEEDRAALSASIEEVLEEGDDVQSRIQSHVGVVEYEVLRRDDSEENGRRFLFIPVRGVISGFCPLREPVRQFWCVYHREGDRVGLDPEPWEDGHLPAPWNVVEEMGPERATGENGDLSTGGWGESVVEATAHSPSSWTMCASPAVNVWA
jgi:hypothetical protein